MYHSPEEQNPERLERKSKNLQISRGDGIRRHGRRGPRRAPRARANMTLSCVAQALPRPAPSGQPRAKPLAQPPPPGPTIRPGDQPHYRRKPRSPSHGGRASRGARAGARSRGGVCQRRRGTERPPAESARGGHYASAVPRSTREGGGAERGWSKVASLSKRRPLTSARTCPCAVSACTPAHT